MTTGDPSGQQASPSRPTPRSAAKKANGSDGKPTRAAATKTGAAKKRAPRAATPKREADVLERLNKLAEPAPPDETLAPMPIPLPAIIEADPSFPMPAPSAEQVAKAEQAEKAAVIDLPAPPHPPAAPSTGSSAGSSNGNGLTRVPTAVAAPSAADVPTAHISAVSTDLATEAIVPATMPVLLAPDTVPEVLPDHTETVFMPAPAPTEAMPATVIGDDVDGSFGMPLPQRPLQRPVAFRKGKPRVRRVTRVVRHVDTWSVFKVALVFNAILFMVCLTSGVLLWNVAHATGTVDNVEKFFEQFGWSTFEFNGGALYHNAWIAGLFVAIGLTGFAVLLATLFNLITDLVGGIRISVLEEEVVARSSTQSVPRSRLWRVAEPEEIDEPEAPSEPG